MGVPGNVVAIPIGFAEITRINWINVPHFDWTLWPLSDRKEDDFKDENGEVLVAGQEIKEIVPIRNRWIYAFETGCKGKGKIAILAREFHADDNGKLSFVDGATRRLIDPGPEPDSTSGTLSSPVPVPVPEAGLPLTRQSEHLYYVCVGTRGRLSKAAIWYIEGLLTGDAESWRMASIYKPQYPGDREALAHTSPKGPFYLNVIDPLTLAEYLSDAYLRCLNGFQSYWAPTKQNPARDAVAKRAAKYQLGRLIRDSFLGSGDPLEIKACLQNDGDILHRFMSSCERESERLHKQAGRQAKALVDFRKSAIWAQARRWYLGPKKPGPKTPEALRIGHFFLDVDSAIHNRLGETHEGRRHLQEQIEDPEGPLTWLIAPEKEKKTAAALYEEWFPIARKSATGVVIGIAEFAPALALHRNVKVVAERVAETLKRMAKMTAVELVATPPKGWVTRGVRTVGGKTIVKVNYKEAEEALEKWIEEGKPKWPHHHKWAKSSDLLCHLFIGVEILNFRNVVSTLIDETRKGEHGTSLFRAHLEVVGAAIDLTVAAEDPIREWARQWGATAGKKAVHEAPFQALLTRNAEFHAAEGDAALVARNAAAATAEKEAGDIVTRLTAPAVFKILGAVSATIDVYVNVSKAIEAYRRGQDGLTAGYGITAGGSFISGLGSILAVSGYGGEAAALTGAALGLVTVGIAVVVIGGLVLIVSQETAWQTFARHCAFGNRRGSGEEPWSGGNFSKWTDDPQSLGLQARVLTSMLCSFKIEGVGAAGAASAVRISFGSIPPHAELQIQFDLTFADGSKRRPGYAIDLHARRFLRAWNGAVSPGLLDFRVEELAPEAPPDDGETAEPKRKVERLLSLTFSPDRPSANARIVRSVCSAIIHYGSGNEAEGPDAARGSIPIQGPVHYPVIDDRWLGRVRTDAIDSLNAEPPEEEEHAEADHDEPSIGPL